MSRSRTKDQIIVLAGGAALVLFVILSWVPQSCPVMRRALIGCPAPHLSQQTPEEQEINRVPHTTIVEPITEIDAKGEVNRGKSRIVFEYRAPKDAKAELAVKKDGESVPLVTVTNPLLSDLKWPVFKVTDPDVSLFTRDPLPQATIEDYLSTKPTGLLADAASARLYGLKSNQYTLLSSVTSLDGYQAVLVAYVPQDVDGTWNWFQQRVDLSQFPLDSAGHLHFELKVDPIKTTDPLLLGEVHIDYRK